MQLISLKEIFVFILKLVICCFTLKDFDLKLFKHKSVFLLTQKSVIFFL